MNQNTNQKRSAASWLMELAKGRYGEYALSVLAALLGVACSLAPYFIIIRLIAALVNGREMSFSECLKRVTDMNAELEGYEKKAADYALKIDQLNTQKTNLQYSTPDITKEAKEYHDAELIYNQKNDALSAAKQNLSSLQSDLETAQKYISDVNNGFITVSGGDAEEQLNVANLKVQKLPAQIQDLQNQISALETEVYNAQVESEKKKNALESKSNNTQGSQQLEKEIAKLTIEQQENAAKLDNRTNDRKQLYEEITIALGGNATYDLSAPQKKIDDAVKKVAKLEAQSVGATITAPVSGTIADVSVVAGKTVAPDDVLATMQPEGKGYSMSFSVTNDQAKRLSVGDKADLVNSWRYDNVDVTLKSIKPDTTDPGQKKLLTFDVSGDVMVGQSLSISVGQKSADYDLIVPNSAIREDNNGKFVLIVETKSSPLGNRYVATRVDVEVLASDDTQSAVSGALYGYEFVITTSTQPVEAGKLVRLAEN